MDDDDGSRMVALSGCFSGIVILCLVGAVIALGYGFMHDHYNWALIGGLFATWLVLGLTFRAIARRNLTRLGR